MATSESFKRFSSNCLRKYIMTYLKQAPLVLPISQMLKFFSSQDGPSSSNEKEKNPSPPHHFNVLRMGGAYLCMAPPFQQATFAENKPHPPFLTSSFKVGLLVHATQTMCHVVLGTRIYIITTFRNAGWAQINYPDRATGWGQWMQLKKGLKR